MRNGLNNLRIFSEPSHIGVIPLQFESFSQPSGVRPDLLAHSPTQERHSPRVERRQHQPHTPVDLWSAAHVAGWLQHIGMQQYSQAFLSSGVSGQVLLSVDSALLKQLGVVAKTDRDRIREKVKEVRKQIEREHREERGKSRRK